MKKVILFSWKQILFVVPVIFSQFVQAQIIYYVDASKTGNSGKGTSWATAKKDLQDAINIASYGDKIWVKAGTYFPTQDPDGNTNPGDPRDKTFFLKAGVKVYGGFAGSETLFSLRNVVANVTRLSGDIGIAHNASDNCYHVVLAVFTTITPATTLDGFTIKDGNANVNSYNTVNTLQVIRSSGGGIYTRNGTNTITNNTIIANAAISSGGGIFNVGTPATLGTTNILTNNIISENTAFNGGAVNAVLCTEKLSDNTFNNNTATGGAAIFINGGTSTLMGNNIINNTATANGGGVTLTGGSTNSIINNSIISNAAVSGAGIYTTGGLNNFTDNVFSNNIATAGGGGICAQGLFNSTLTNNTFSNNAAATGGGGIFTSGNINTLIVNNIFWGNTKGANALIQGADYYESGANGNTFINNLLQLATGNYTATGAGNYDLGTGATGNLFATNPNFINAADVDGADNINRTPDDGLHLQVGSPAINAGANSVSAPTTDITGVTRGIVPFDLGAYEWFTCSGNTTLYVDGSIATSGTGKTWATAYKTLDEALFEANNCVDVSVINVAEGIYKPGRKPYLGGIEITTPDPRDATFHIRASLTLYGGFPSGGGERNIAAHVTTLSGDIDKANDTSDNCYHVVLSVFTTITPATAIDGFTIKDGNASGNTMLTVNTLSINRGNGGGIYTRNGANTIANNTIINNTAIFNGGGIFSTGTPLTLGTSNTITNNIFSGNRGANGGGISNVLCTNIVSHNRFNNNKAVVNGGGIFSNGSNDTITNNNIFSNTATRGGGIATSGGKNSLTNNIIVADTATTGGGIYAIAGSGEIANNVLCNNIATDNGGGVYAGSIANSTLTDNTFSNNKAATNGGGIFTDGNVNTQLLNNIFRGNEKAADAAIEGADYFENSTNGNTFTNNLLQLASNNYTTTGTGNYDLGATAAGNLFAVNPNFLNEADPDGVDNIYRTADDGLRLICNSPAIDAGIGATPATDIMGISRQGNVDMGAYESNGLGNTMLPVSGQTSLQSQSNITMYGSCSELIATVQSNGASPISGSTTAKVWIENSPSFMIENQLVKRHYEIIPVNNSDSATGKVTLYFTQADFDDFNAVSLVDLPTGPSDAAGKSNLLIEKQQGASSDGTGLPGTYPGTPVNIDPADEDIIWNSNAGRWEVSFDVTGFSGFFVKTITDILPNG